MIVDPNEFLNPFRTKLVQKLNTLANTTGNDHEEIIKRLLAKPFKIPIEGYTGDFLKLYKN